MILQTPTISDFQNATHTHESNSGGGALSGYSTTSQLVAVSGTLYSLIASTSGSTGSTDHALLSNLDYVNANHTGFASDASLVAVSGILYSLIASTSGQSTSGSGTTNHALLTNLDYTNSGHTGFASQSSLVAVSGNLATRNITVVAGDGTSSLATGALKAYVRSPVNCNITQCTLLADVSGSIVIDIWKSTFSSFPPVSGNSITDSSKPTISGGISYQDSTLTNWTKTVSANDIFEFKIDSVSSIKKINIILDVTTI